MPGVTWTQHRDLYKEVRFADEAGALVKYDGNAQGSTDLVPYRHHSNQPVQPMVPVTSIPSNNWVEHVGAPQFPDIISMPTVLNFGQVNIYHGHDSAVKITNMPSGTINSLGPPSLFFSPTTRSFTGAIQSRETYQPPAISSAAPVAQTTAPPAEKPIAPPAAVPAARHYCVSCKLKFDTQEYADKHVKEFPYHCSKCHKCRKQDKGLMSEDGKWWWWCCRSNGSGTRLSWEQGGGNAVL